MPELRSCLAVAVLATASWTLAGCQQRETHSEMQWARAALERNPALEVLAADEANGVFTVRSKASGELRTLKLAELIAGPADAPAAAAEPAGPVPAAPRDEALPPRAPATDDDEALARAGEAAAPEAGAAAAASSADSEERARYTVDRSNGRVQITGPGISLSSTGPGGGRALRRGTDASLICEGKRFLRIDNRTLEVDGDAVIARDGCELHITNSRIVASGSGVVASAARVHIRNSTVEGAAASIDASQGADVYLQASTLQGLARRLGGATVHDLGGNDWR